MAFRAITRYFWNSNLKNAGGLSAAARGGATFTPLRSFASSATMDAAHYRDNLKVNGFLGGLEVDMAPIYMVAGLVVIVLSVGAHTAKQQLLHSPAVHVNKKRREGTPDVNDPDSVIGEADKFINKSFLRKVGHIQANHNVNHNDPSVRPNIYTKSREAETLKSVGV